jgi:hypothetical protein
MVQLFNLDAKPEFFKDAALGIRSVENGLASERVNDFETPTGGI